MSQIFLFGGVKIGSNTALHCFVLQWKLINSIKYVVYEIRRQNVFIVRIGENTILNKKNICDRTLSPYWKNNLPPTTKDCMQTTYGEKSSSEREGAQIMSWWYSWVVNFCQFPYLTFVTKFEPLCSLKKIFFKYCVCVRSFEPFCSRRTMVLQYGDSG